MSNTNSMNCLLCGVGGQGTVLASRLIAAAYLKRGIDVKQAETIGMSQRGGSVVSHVRSGKTYSPLIPKKEADLIIAFEPAEAVRCIDYLKENGTVVVNTRVVKPVTDALRCATDKEYSGYSGNKMIEYLRSLNIKVITVDTDAIVGECGSSKIVNVALLGAAIKSGAFDKAEFAITKEDMKTVIKEKVKEQFYDVNIKALELGGR